MTRFAKIDSNMLQFKNHGEANHGVVVVVGEFIEYEIKQRKYNLLSSAIHASNIRSIWAKSPISDGKTNDFNITSSKSLNVIFSNPRIPMSTHDFISKLANKFYTAAAGRILTLLGHCFLARHTGLLINFTNINMIQPY